ncbi:putative mRNA splicing protein [Aulographum hederae CBS 113979]|uniref:Pre-mRNA-splicing factor SLU7 n=1 Tax=Aulographum hederae CBS 113979 TaxID=1176131 RepID=A0A6G1GPH9_9PEZI|nr:putative mRNA splicing protein [Aulographum hederae CBS 113979]
MAPPAKKQDPSAANKEHNEYIPSFISKKPFYIPDDGTSSGNDYLEHQRLKSTKYDTPWYDRSKAKPAAKKWRKGACDNCGAMGHPAKECLERPRKRGARWTHHDIKPDDAKQDVRMGWDAKRDRWNGYDATEYTKVVEEYDTAERMRRLVQGKKTGDDDNDDNDDEEANAGDKYEEETDMGRRQPTSTRQLRLREDTAKYLVNLDLESAKYDPKTRSMVDSGATKDESADLVAEEGFMRASGDAAEFEKAQRYAWERSERGDADAAQLHLQANPTTGEYLRKKEAKEAEERRAAQKKALIERYGSQDQHAKPSLLSSVAVTENERYVEYDERGKIKGAPKRKSKSRFAEDVFLNNHTAVWGSWWCEGKWGFACCHSLVKQSYCTGEEGKTAFEEERNMRLGEVEGREEREGTEGAGQDAATGKIVDVGDIKESEDAAESKDTKGKAKENTKNSKDLNRKRTLEMMSGGVTEEDMEEYQRRKGNAADPMAGMVDKD